MVENLDHFVVEYETFLSFLCRDEFRKVLKNLLEGNGDIDGLEFGLLVIKDDLDALLDLFEGNGLFVGEGLGLAHEYCDLE